MKKTCTPNGQQQQAMMDSYLLADALTNDNGNPIDS
jgi:hypothetical protein